jgi:uncharacterized membrane protein YtjA (UPF0391 family)
MTRLAIIFLASALIVAFFRFGGIPASSWQAVKAALVISLSLVVLFRLGGWLRERFPWKCKVHGNYDWINLRR